MSLLAMTRLELRRLFVSPLTWVVGALSLAWLSYGFLNILESFLSAQIRLAAIPDSPGFTHIVAVPTLGGFAYLAFFVVPLLTMSSLANDRREGRLALLLGMGLPPSRVVLGKYAAQLAWLLLWFGFVLAMPLALAHATDMDWGQLASASLGVVLLLAALAALGLACSAFAPHPAIAAAAAFLITFGLWKVNDRAQAAGVTDGAINWLAMSSHLQPLLRGLVTSVDVAWFALLVIVCLALAIRRVAAERERG